MTPNMIIRQRPVKFIDFTEEIRKSFEEKKTPKKPRVKLDLWQISTLEKAFEDDSHPSQKAKTRLSVSLGITIKSVQIWFQNRRAKEKAKKDVSETESESNHESIECEVAAAPKVYFHSTKKASTQEKASTGSKLSQTASLFDSSEFTELSMKYDASFVDDSISLSIDQSQDSVYSEYDSFLSSFSTPIICMSLDKQEKAEDIEAAQNKIAKEARHNYTQAALFNSASQRKCQLTNGQVEYEVDLERVNFFSELHHQMSNNTM
ncbi:hypothetical protein NEIG_00816 [Nematocida sp. ERTm5]|nr:hypothetical protein NEIG_00816 [Nematocida sp. ERTm5]